MQEDKLGKFKGLHNSMYTNLSQSVLFTSIEQHIWAYLCTSISPFLLDIPSTLSSLHIHPNLSPTPTLILDINQWTWSHLDLSKEG